MRQTGRVSGKNAGSWFKVIAAIVVLRYLVAPLFEVFGPILIIFLFVGVFLFAAKRISRQKEDRDSGEETSSSFDHDRSDERRSAQRGERARSADALASAVPTRQESRAEELQDLLSAGIIEREEYNERMRALKLRRD